MCPGGTSLPGIVLYTILYWLWYGRAWFYAWCFFKIPHLDAEIFKCIRQSHYSLSAHYLSGSIYLRLHLNSIQRIAISEKGNMKSNCLESNHLFQQHMLHSDHSSEPITCPLHFTASSQQLSLTLTSYHQRLQQLHYQRYYMEHTNELGSANEKGRWPYARWILSIVSPSRCQTVASEPTFMSVCWGNWAGNKSTVGTTSHDSTTFRPKISIEGTQWCSTCPVPFLSQWLPVCDCRPEGVWD